MTRTSTDIARPHVACEQLRQCVQIADWVAAANAESCVLCGCLTCRLEELDRISVGIVELNLSTSRAGFHLITERQPRFLEPLDLTSDVGHTQDNAIPSARFLLAPIGHWPRA